MGPCCEALTFYFPADVGAGTRSKFAAALELLLLDVREASRAGGADQPACVARAHGFVRGPPARRGGHPVHACAVWIAWRDPGARDAFRAHGGGRANLALLMREEFGSVRWGAEEQAGFWTPLEVFATEGWEGGGLVALEKLNRSE